MTWNGPGDIEGDAEAVERIRAGVSAGVNLSPLSHPAYLRAALDEAVVANDTIVLLAFDEFVRRDGPPLQLPSDTYPPDAVF